MRKIYYCIFSIIFLIVILLPFIGMPFYDTNATNENRHLTEFPNFSKQKLRHAIPQLNNYIADHHAFRNELSKQYFYTKLNILNESPIPDEAILGKEDWLYLGNAYNNTYNYALGIQQIDNGELEKICSNINKMKTYCEAHGIKFYLAIPPNKSTIYPEYLPQTPNTQTRGKELMAKILKDKFNIEIIDFEETLIAHKASARLYYKRNSHWNQYSSLFATQQLFNEIAKDFRISSVNIEDYSIEEKYGECYGDISNMLQLEDEEDIFFDIKRKVLHKIEFSEGQLAENKDQYIHIKNTTSDNTIKGLFFRDSFFDAMQPICADLCAEEILVNNNAGVFNINTFNEILSFYSPDFFVLEIVERHFNLISFNEEQAK